MNFDLTFFSTFGKIDIGKGQFDCLQGIACDRTGKVYVVDSHNHHIQVLTAEGKLLRMFGRLRHGERRGELVSPISITIDTNDTASDKVYIGDYNKPISVFTSEGRFLNSFGRNGKEPGEFRYPRGLAVNVGGVVYDCGNINYFSYVCMYLHY